MKDKSILNNIRENFVSKFSSSKLTLDEFIREYESRVYAFLGNKKPDIFKIYAYMEILVAYSDFFKLMSIRKKENIATVDDYYYLCSIDNIHNIDDLIMEVFIVPAFLEKILKSMYEFYMLSYLGRSNAYRSLTEDEKIYLSNFSSLFDEEKEFYERDVELEDYLFHYKMKQKIIESNNEISVLDTEHIINEICGYIVNLSKYNYENYVNNIKDLLIFYYEWAKFDVMHEKTLIDEEIEGKEGFVSQFETSDFGEMGHDVLYDSNFLFFLVDFYCIVKENNTIHYKDGREITYCEVEEYVEHIDEEKVKEKMKYKKTRI